MIKLITKIINSPLLIPLVLAGAIIIIGGAIMLCWWVGTLILVYPQYHHLAYFMTGLFVIFCGGFILALVGMGILGLCEFLSDWVKEVRREWNYNHPPQNAKALVAPPDKGFEMTYDPVFENPSVIKQLPHFGEKK